MPIRSALTVKQYDHSLQRLRVGLGMPPATLPFTLASMRFLLEEPQRVATWIHRSGGADTTQRNYFIAVMSRLHEFSAPKDAEAVAAARAVYGPAFYALKQRIAAADATQRLTAREEAKAITWPEVLAVRDVLAQRRHASFSDLQDWVILCLYTYIPPRRIDFTPMVVLQREPRAPVEGENYLILRATSGEFLFRAFKTVAVVGPQRVPIPPELLLVLREWRTVNTSPYLLVRADGSAMPEDQLSRRLVSIFERNTGRSVGSSMLRKAYVSWMRRGELGLAQKQALARDLGHSMHTEERTYLRQQLAGPPLAGVALAPDVAAQLSR